MSKSLNTAFVAQFDAMVKHDYQAMGHDLRPHVRIRTGVTGSTHRFPKLGAGVAHQRTAPQTDVVPMNVAHDNVTVTLSDWEAPEYTDIFDQAKVNFDEKSELSVTIAQAIGRRDDQLIIDALDAGTYTTTNQVDADVGGLNTNMNVEKVRKAKNLLDAQNVPDGDRVLLIHANQLEAMLSEIEATSSDFNTVKALVNGELDTFLGFKWKTIGNRSEGGLSLAGTDRQCYAWHRPSVGFAEGIAMRVSVDWIPHKTSWLANAIFSAGSIIIDNVGVIQILADDDAVA